MELKSPKTIIILGTSRADGDTVQLVNRLSNNQIKIVDLNQLDITPFDYQHNNRGDDYLTLMEDILNYDAIVLATPIYWYTMSAQMKVFIDRLTDCITIRKDIGRNLYNKRLYVLASYGGSMPKEFEAPFSQTCEYMKMRYSGCFYYYSGNDKSYIHNNNGLDNLRNTIMDST